MGISFRVFLTMFVTTILGCGPDTSSYLTAENPTSLRACPSADIRNPAEQSYDAMMASLTYEGWVIEAANRENLLLQARMCAHTLCGGDYLGCSDEACVSLKFAVQQSGIVSAYNPPSKRFFTQIRADAEEWVYELTQTYSKVRCFSRDELSRWSTSRKSE